MNVSAFVMTNSTEFGDLVSLVTGIKNGGLFGGILFLIMLIGGRLFDEIRKMKKRQRARDADQDARIKALESREGEQSRSRSRSRSGSPVEKIRRSKRHRVTVQNTDS